MTASLGEWAFCRNRQHRFPPSRDDGLEIRRERYTFARSSDAKSQIFVAAASVFLTMEFHVGEYERTAYSTCRTSNLHHLKCSIRRSNGLKNSFCS